MHALPALAAMLSLGLTLPEGLTARDGALVAGQPAGVRVAGRLEASCEVEPADPDALAPDIAWRTAPRMGPRARLALEPGRGVRVAATCGGEPLVVVAPGGVLLAFGPEALADPANAALARWGYLPYLLHAAVERAAGRAPPRFAGWPAAPVPRARLRHAFVLGLALLVVAYALGLLLARRRARARPEAHRALFAALSAPTSPTSGASPSRAADAAWTRPGIARPLGGFFLFLSATLLAMGPYLYLTAAVIPSRVQPFPDVDGAWAPVEELAQLAWALCDLGLSVAFVQRFAEHRVTDPRRALQAAQLWVWWQLAAGLMMLAAGGALACGILPHTHYALFSRVVLLRALLQVPNILSLFTLFFQAAQRFDYQLGLDLLEKRLLFVALPIPFVLWLRAVGRAHPALGESWGALVGIACGQYATLLVSCALGFVLYRRLRLPLGPLFLAGFDRRTIAELLRFGVGVVLGKAPFFLANFAEIGILTTLLPGYPAWLGIRQLLVSRILFTLYFLYGFTDSGIPAFSEAFAARKHALVRYYVVRYLQFGHLFVAPLAAFLVAAGRPLVLHALRPEWHPAARYLPLAAASGLFLPLTWISDSFQKGAGRSGLNALIDSCEQAGRIALFWLVVPALGFAGIFVGILGSISLKCAVAWTINHRRLCRLEAHAWTSTLAPLCAGALWLAALSACAALLPSTRAAAVGLFVAGAALTFPAGFFLCGLVGGLDGAALVEIRAAAALAGPMRPIARGLAHAAALGARLCPLTRPAPPLAAEAAREADEIAAREHAR